MLCYMIRRTSLSSQLFINSLIDDLVYVDKTLTCAKEIIWKSSPWWFSDRLLGWFFWICWIWTVSTAESIKWSKIIFFANIYGSALSAVFWCHPETTHPSKVNLSQRDYDNSFVFNHPRYIWPDPTIPMFSKLWQKAITDFPSRNFQLNRWKGTSKINTVERKRLKMGLPVQKQNLYEDWLEYFKRWAAAD